MRARQAFRRLLTRTKYSLAKPLNRTSIRGKDWSFLENFDDLADLAKFDFQIEALYRGGPKSISLVRAGHYDRKSYAAFRKFDGLFSSNYRILICIPWLRVGGAERVAANLAAALRHLYGPGSVAVLVLDFTADQIRKHNRNEPTADSWFPPDVPVIDMTETVTLEHDQRLAGLAKLLLGIAPQFIVNVNSKTMWDCFLAYGRQLASQINLVGCLFCNDRDLNDAPIGYAASYFRETLTNLSSVITDQTAFISELATRFNLIPNEYSKLKCLYQPTTAPKSISDGARFGRLRRPNSYRRQILWTGRLTRQKNPELLLQIAGSSPDCDFHVFGTGQLPNGHRPRNVLYRGPFERFNNIETEIFDAFLYTSRWDGLPNVLLEAAAHHLPIIAQVTGGIGEIVNETTGWPVSPTSDAGDFNAILRGACFEFEQQCGPARIAAMSELIGTRHSFEAFCRTLGVIFGSRDFDHVDHQHHHRQR
jgi:glycosyltransferase involved in cell wall biosynthesis